MTAVLALARRDLGLTRSYRLSVVSDLGWGVLNLLVYYFISKLVDTGDEAIGAAPSYFSFAVCGIVMLVVIQDASSGVAQRVRDEQLTGTLEMLCAQPVRTAELAFGLISFPLGFAIVRAAGYLALAAVALDLDAPDADWVGAVVMLVTSGFVFAAIGVLAAGATIIFKRATSMTAAIVFGMTFISGALFPVSVLPDWLQSLGHVMPTWFALEGLRAALFEGGEWASDALALVGYSIVGIPLAVWGMSASLARAKRQGTLGQY